MEIRNRQDLNAYTLKWSLLLQKDHTNSLKAQFSDLGHVHPQV